MMMMMMKAVVVMPLTQLPKRQGNQQLLLIGAAKSGEAE